MNTKIKVTNLKCHGCAATIKKGLTKFEEVKSVDIDIKNSLINIEFTGDDINIKRYKNKLSKLGYPEENDNNVISVGKSFISCAIGRINN